MAWPCTCLDRLADLPELYVSRGYVSGPLRVDRIAPSPEPKDLGYQEQISATLGGCRPALERIASPEELLRALNDDLNLPVIFTSYGPTAEAKNL